MQVWVTKKGKVRVRAGKFQYVHRISLGECIAIIVDILILIAIFMVG